MADIGTGATLTYAGLTANLMSVEVSGVAREAIESSHLGTTTARTFVVGDLYDPGTIEAEIQYDTEDPMTNMAVYDDAASVLTLTFPLATGDATAATLAASAFVVDHSISVGLEELVTATFTFKLSGAITLVNASV
jgi:hypothetical protein